MNKADVVEKVAAISGQSPAVCEKVIDAFEKVMRDELTRTGTISEAFREIGGMMSRILGDRKET